MKIVYISAVFVLFLSTVAFATPEYSDRTSQGCMTCHTNPESGALAARGLEFAASGYKWPPEGGYRVLGPVRKSVRLLLGFVHITASFLWFGTILYVHLLLRPAYASKGLPKGEMILGMATMSLVGVTGALLTLSRIKSLSVLWASRWGVLLSIKIAIYLVMVSSALYIVAFVGPKLRAGRKKAEPPKDGAYDPLTLSNFDGREGRPAYIAFKGVVYDVSGMKLWRNGAHVKHRAGEDLSDALAKAPHGEEKLGGLKVVGKYYASLKPPLNPAQKAFYFVAYMNLALVFVVLVVLSLWRWGL